MITTPVLLLAALTATLLPACAGAATRAGSGRPVVVAAENFWGSIAAQLGGDRVEAVSIISNPDTDPHAYEPTAQDARTVAEAQYVIVNGAGYDPWASRLIAADASGDRAVLDVADLVGRKDGDNPHMWYSPPIVQKVIDQITADLKRLDSADGAYFDQQRQAFTTSTLKAYNDLRAEIRGKYSGVPVGATESIVVDIAQDLGLDLITPPDYMRAISEGNDPSSQDKATFDAQISGRRIKVLVFNKQNSTTDIQALVDRAMAVGIPVVAITETMDPAAVTFQDWQSGQLQALAAALARATGR